MQKLTADGVSGGQAMHLNIIAAASKPSAKGRIFDDCYRLAKVWADKHGTAKDKPVNTKKKSRTARTVRPSLL
jgi:hypothetical protein